MTEFALSLGNAVSDQPFNDDFFTAVLRYKASKKRFWILLKAPADKLGVKDAFF